MHTQEHTLVHHIYTCMNIHNLIGASTIILPCRGVNSFLGGWRGTHNYTTLHEGFMQDFFLGGGVGGGGGGGGGTQLYNPAGFYAGSFSGGWRWTNYRTTTYWERSQLD